MNYLCLQKKCNFHLSETQLSELQAENYNYHCPSCKKPLELERKDLEVRDFIGEIQEDSSKTIGRKREIQKIMDFIKKKHSGLLWISGKAGIGKSFLLAKISDLLLQKAEQDESIVLPYRFRNQDRERCNRDAFIQFIKERLVTNNIIEDSKGTLHSRPLKDCLAKIKKAKRLVILLDGLDEIEQRDADFAFDFPASLSFPSVLWICTGKPTPIIEEAMTKADTPLPRGLPPMQDEEIRNLIERSLAGDSGKASSTVFKGIKDFEHFLSQAVERAKGLPLYAKHLAEDLKVGEYQAGKKTSFDLPAGLQEYHQDLFVRMASGDLDMVRTQLLTLFAVANEPLAFHEIRDFLLHRKLIPLDSKNQLLESAIQSLAPLVSTAPDPEEEVGYLFYHPALREHALQSPDLEASVSLTKDAFVELALKKAPPSSLVNYLIRSGVYHLIDSERDKEARGLLLNPHHLFQMHAQGIQLPELLGYWTRLGGEQKAQPYLEVLDHDLDQESFPQIDLICQLVQKAGWSTLSGNLARKSLSFYFNFLGPAHPKVVLSWLNLADLPDCTESFSSRNESQAMAKWSELRTQGEFLENVDPKAFEKEVGIPHSRAIEIEEALKAGIQ